MWSWLSGFLKHPEKRTALSRFAREAELEAAGAVAVTAIIFFAEHKDADRIIQNLIIGLPSAILAYLATYFFAFRAQLARMREIVDAASSVAIESTQAETDGARAAIESTRRRRNWLALCAILLFLFSVGFSFLRFLPAYASIIPDASLQRAIVLIPFASAVGISFCIFRAAIALDRARLVLDARSKVIASIDEGQVSGATGVLKARDERDEHRYRQNLLATFKIKHFELRQAGIFSKLTWNLEPGINVLLGRNGFGKSFLLRLLAGMVSYDNAQLARLLSDPDKEQRLAVYLLRNNESIAVERGMVSFSESWGKIPLLAIPDSRFINRSRNITTAEGRNKLDDDGDYVDLVRFGAHHFLYALPYDSTIELGLAQMCIDALGRSRTQPPTSPQLDLVSDVIRELAGERFRFHRIESTKARFFIEVETDCSPGRPISIQQASQGTLSIVAICGLIYQYLRALHPKTAEPELCKQDAIVIIDEVDAHLHPAWQRKVTPLLRKHFPNIQFILTAHSPLVVAGCGHGEVAVLRRDNAGLMRIEDYQRDFIGAMTRDIYRKVFDIEDRDVTFEDLYASLPELPDLREKLERELAKPETSRDPALILHLKERIRSIERTKKEQEAELDYMALEQKYEQLKRQYEALRKREGSGAA